MEKKCGTCIHWHSNGDGTGSCSADIVLPISIPVIPGDPRVPTDSEAGTNCELWNGGE